MTAKVRSKLLEIPKMVDRLPSIPASPRFAKTSIPARGLAKASISLIGREDPTNSAEPSGTPAAIVRRALCSLQLWSSSITFEANFEISFQSEIQVGFSVETSSFGSAKNTCEAVRLVSIVEILGSITKVFSARFRKLLILRDSVVRPITIA